MSRVAYLLAGASFAMIQAPALAQDSAPPASNSAAEEKPADATRDGVIVVTATKSGEQELQEVPLAIQAFSGENLKEQNIQNLAELISSVPGASEGFNQSVSARFYNIRGVGSGSANGDSPIGYYVDDVPFNVPNFGIAPPMRFIDVERVEVLRGPQGTLYGQGSAGGVFIFHTKDPDLEEINFAAEASLSKTGEAEGLNYELSGVFSVPIVKDVLAVRVSGGLMKNQGWADEYYRAPVGAPNETGVNVVRNDDLRVVALLKPAENISLRAQYWRFRPRQQGLSGLASIDPPYFTNTDNQPNFATGDFKLYSLTANVDFDDFAITSASTYLEGSFGINFPIASSPFNPQGSFISNFFPKGFTQEFRVNSVGRGPLHWVIGGQYQDSEGPQANEVTFLPVNFNNNTIVDSYAVFGEVSYELFDGKLVPLAGLRQYWENRAFADNTGTGAPQSKSVTTWRLNLSYLPSDRLTIFVGAATGFRPGQVQSEGQRLALIADGIPAELQLEPTDVTNYEIGVRWQSDDRSLRVGANAYLIDITNDQTSLNTSSGIGAFINLGNLRTKGLDVDIAWDTPLNGLTLTAIGNVNDGEYTFVRPEVQFGLPFIVEGGRPVNSVEFNYRVAANYNHALTNDLDGFGNISLSNTGNRYQANNTFVEPFQSVNAILGVRKGPWEASIFANNLLDDRGPTSTFFGSGVSAIPRTIGVRLRVNYQ